jgi:hypothetical protein
MSDAFVSIISGESKAVCNQSDLRAAPGTYALLLSSASNAVIRVGRLGDTPPASRYRSPMLPRGTISAIMVSWLTLQQNRSWTSTPAKCPYAVSFTVQPPRPVMHWCSPTGPAEFATPRCWLPSPKHSPHRAEQPLRATYVLLLPPEAKYVANPSHPPRTLRHCNIRILSRRSPLLHQ